MKGLDGRRFRWHFDDIFLGYFQLDTFGINCKVKNNKWWIGKFLNPGRDPEKKGRYDAAAEFEISSRRKRSHVRLDCLCDGALAAWMESASVEKANRICDFINVGGGCVRSCFIASGSRQVHGPLHAGVHSVHGANWFCMWPPKCAAAERSVTSTVDWSYVTVVLSSFWSVLFHLFGYSLPMTRNHFGNDNFSNFWHTTC